MVKIPFTLFCLSLVMILLVVGCTGSKPTDVSTPTETNEPSLTPIQHTATVSETSSPVHLPKTLEPYDSNFIRPTNTPMLNQACQAVQVNDFSSLPEIQGVIPLIGSTSKIVDSLLLDLTSGDKFFFPSGNHEYIHHSGEAASPDGKWFAYLTDSITGDQTLNILDARGVLQKEIVLSSIRKPISFVSFGEWIDNENILLIWAGEDSNGDIWPNLSTTVILNPFNGNKQEFESDYPDMFSLYPDFVYTWGNYFLSLSVYNPPLNRVLYLSYEGIALWDLKNQREIKLIASDFRYRSIQPQWSPDGNQFVIDLDTDTGRNIFLISKDGVERQITFMDRYEDRDIYGITWSPDGKQLAYWLYVRWDEKAVNGVYYLNTIDVLTSEIKTYCITAYNWREFSPKWYPIWSPDGKYLVVAAERNQDKSKPEAILVDLANNHAYRLAEDVVPLGWMVNDSITR